MGAVTEVGDATLGATKMGWQEFWHIHKTSPYMYIYKEDIQYVLQPR